MKLELKHLAPYLPYQIKILDCITGKSKVMNMGQGSSTHWIGIKTVLNYWKSGNPIYNPIFHNLSDLTKEIDHNGERFVPSRIIENLFDIEDFTVELEYLVKREDDGIVFISMEKQMNILEKLFEWKFDVFGLIPHDLAIDINTIQ